MPHAEIASKQALYTLSQLHAELAGKLKQNKRETARLMTSMKQVEAVMKLLEPGYSLRQIAIRRRKQNPWFKRGTMFRHVIDVLRNASVPLSVREITDRVLAAHGVTDATPKAIRDLWGGVQASLRNNAGKSVEIVGEASPARWRLREP